MKPYSISLFFPAYNEEGAIAESVAQAEAVLKQLTHTYEIIVVNDGSRDATGAIADALAAKNARVRVVHHATNKGYGGALMSGLQAAQYDYIFFTDADLQFDLRELKLLLAHVPNYDVVLGYRAKRQDPFFRMANAYGWHVLNRTVFGLKVHDIDCAFKLIKRDRVKDIAITSQGAMVSAELLILLQRQGVTFKEVPVSHHPRRSGSATGAKPAVIARAFGELIQFYRRSR
jgi:glycosyltransferase involved in cell wall biosynthesis